MSRKILFTALAAIAPMAPVEAGPELDDTRRSRASEKTPGSVTELKAVSVTGQGETRQVQRIDTRETAVLPPGTSIQKVLNHIAGVNVQSNDAFGANEESQSISLRGFNTTRLGYTLDGVPLGDNAYGNYNGLNISRALISENFGGAELAQGIGSLGIASTSNLGGTVQYFSDDPSATPGARVATTFGSDRNRRNFARVDTGEHGGFSMYLSGVRATAAMWAAPRSPSHTNQFNVKAVQAFARGHITAFADVSRSSQADYAYLSKDGMARGLGWNWNLYAPDWQRALAAAYCAPETYDAARCSYSGGVNNIDDAYFQSRALRKDQLYYLAGEFEAADHITLRAQAYHHANAGQGHWWAPGQPSYPGTDDELPISIRSSNYSINRTGVLASLAWEFGPHQVDGGVWYEDNRHNIRRNFYYIDGPINDDRYLSNPDRRLFNQDYVIVTRQAYVQGSFKFFDDKLSVDVGAKSPHTSMKARQREGAFEALVATGRLNAGATALPQFGVGYRFGESQEVFASYAQNIAAFQGGGAGGPLLVNQTSFDATRGRLKPERSETTEAGWRINRDSLEASAVVYHVMFDNRLLSLNPCPSIQEGTSSECTTRYVNVGSVKSRGAEFTFVLKPGKHLRWYNTASFNRSTYQSNYLQGGTVIPTRGKTTVDTPNHLYSSELSWKKGAWNAALRGKYTGKRYVTYTNDRGFGGFTTFDFGLGYDFGKVGFAKSMRASFNVTNLTDKRHATSLSAFANSDPEGVQQTFQASAPRQMFVALDMSF
jgi:iron complex outermembrane recepter protein